MTPRPAATLVLIRPRTPGVEVLMVQRPARGFFGGLWVFPGGGVEAIDDSDAARRAVIVPDDCEDFAWRAAAMRETIEEVGLALTDPPMSDPITGAGAEVYSRVAERGVRLDARRLRLLSQWVTPAESPTRFDARFYLAVIDDDPTLTPQPHEVVATEWTSPAAALTRLENEEWAMITPTIHHLQWLTRFHHPSEAWAAAARVTVHQVEPIIESDGSEVRVLLPSWAALP